MRLGWRALGGIRRFFRNRRGSVSVDFVVSIPILLGVLVLTSEYGRVLQTRTALDNAVADAVRYLTRVPLTNDQFPAESVAIAKAMITTRISSPHVVVTDPVVSVVEVDAAGQAKTRWVTLLAGVAIESPALAVLNIGNPEMRTEGGELLAEVEGLAVFANETFQHFGR